MGRETQAERALKIARKRTRGTWTAAELDAAIGSREYASKLLADWARQGLAERLPPEPKVKRAPGVKGEPGRPAVRYRMKEVAG